MGTLQIEADCFFSPDADLPGFVPVKVRSLFKGVALPCDFYFPSLFESEEEIRPDKVLIGGEIFTEENDRTLSNENVDLLYIAPQDEAQFLKYLTSRTREAIKSKEVEGEKKTQFLYDSLEALIQKVFRESLSDSSILLGKAIIEDFVDHISNSETSATSLLSLFSRDYYTFSHCAQMATLGMSFCSFLGWNKPEIEDFGIGSLFHDFGKSLINEEILNKPGKLDLKELDIIRQHPVAGYQQLKKTECLSKDQLYIVLYHHEAADGSGYPDGLSGDGIPLYARVAHIVDVFDALTSHRTYKKAMSPPDALALMKTEMLGSFDEELLTEFTNFLQKKPSASRGDWDKEIKAGLGTPILVQFEPLAKKMRSFLVGMELNQYIILRLCDSSRMGKLRPGMPLIVRYIYAGEAYGFKGVVWETVYEPPLVVCRYPKQVEKLNLRCELRLECFLPAEIEIGEKTTRCVLADVSYKGCRISIKDDATDILPFIEKDKAILISANLPGRNEPASLPGWIRNVEKTGEGSSLGIQFGELSKESAGQWRAFIDDMIEVAR